MRVGRVLASLMTLPRLMKGCAGHHDVEKKKSKEEYPEKGKDGNCGSDFARDSCQPDKKSNDRQKAQDSKRARQPIPLDETPPIESIEQLPFLGVIFPMRPGLALLF